MVSGAPEVAVVVPVYNGRATLPACLESIFAQSLPPRAVYVVDNGSTDGTREWLEAVSRREPRVRVVGERRRGSAAARNAGVRCALGEGRRELVAFTDADCVPDRVWLESLCRGFDHPRIGAVTGSIRPLVTGTLVGRYLGLSAFDPAARDRLACSVALEEGVAGGNTCVRVRALEDVGPFDESFLVAQDWELGLRFLKAGWWLRYTSAAVVYHRHAERTVRDLLRLAARYARGYPAVLRRHFPRRLFFSAFGHRVVCPSPFPVSVRLTSPGKAALALGLVGLLWPPAWLGLGVYGAYLGLRVRQAARREGVPVRAWELPAMVALQVVESAVSDGQALLEALRQGVLCV